MSKLASTVGVMVVGLMMLAAAGPTITKLIHALIPLAVLLTVLIAALRLLWFYTR